MCNIMILLIYSTSPYGRKKNCVELTNDLYLLLRMLHNTGSTKVKVICD